MPPGALRDGVVELEQIRVMLCEAERIAAMPGQFPGSAMLNLSMQDDTYSDKSIADLERRSSSRRRVLEFQAVLSTYEFYMMSNVYDILSMKQAALERIRSLCDGNDVAAVEKTDDEIVRALVRLSQTQFKGIPDDDADPFREHVIAERRVHNVKPCVNVLALRDSQTVDIPALQFWADADVNAKSIRVAAERTAEQVAASYSMVESLIATHHEWLNLVDRLSDAIDGIRKLVEWTATAADIPEMNHDYVLSLKLVWDCGRDHKSLARYAAIAHDVFQVAGWRLSALTDRINYVFPPDISCGLLADGSNGAEESKKKRRNKKKRKKHRQQGTAPRPPVNATDDEPREAVSSIPAASSGLVSPLPQQQTSANGNATTRAEADLPASFPPAETVPLTASEDSCTVVLQQEINATGEPDAVPAIDEPRTMEDGTVLAAFPCAVEVQAENSSAPDTTTPASSEPLRPDKDVVTLGTVCVATPGANLDHHQYQVIRVPEGYLQRPVIFYTVPMPGSYSDTFLGNELLSFVRNTDAQLSIDNVIRDRIRKQVEAHVAACCRQCSLVVSGSTAAGLNLYAPMSNLDLVIVNADPVVLPYRGLETLAAVITSQDAMFFNVFIIANGDGPVLELRVRHHAAIVVHVTWNAPQVSTALAFAMNAQYQYPMFRPLLLYLKYFLFMHGLKFPSTGGLFPALLQTLVLVHLRVCTGTIDLEICDSNPVVP